MTRTVFTDKVLDVIIKELHTWTLGRADSKKINLADQKEELKRSLHDAEDLYNESLRITRLLEPIKDDKSKLDELVKILKKLNVELDMLSPEMKDVLGWMLFHKMKILTTEREDVLSEPYLDTVGGNLSIKCEKLFDDFNSTIRNLQLEVLEHLSNDNMIRKRANPGFIRCKEEKLYTAPLKNFAKKIKFFWEENTPYSFIAKFDKSDELGIKQRQPENAASLFFVICVRYLEPGYTTGSCDNAMR